jgi:hypothetical protein
MLDNFACPDFQQRKRRGGDHLPMGIGAHAYRKLLRTDMGFGSKHTIL